MSKPRRQVSAAPPSRAELERRLAESEARYRDLVDGLPLTTYVAAMGVQGSFSFISGQVEAMLGFKSEEWLTNRRLWLSRLHPADRQRLIPLLVRAHGSRGGDRFSAEYRLLDSKGRPVWIRDESRVVRDDAGMPLFVQGTWTEITGRKSLEQESAGKARELDTSKEDLRQLVAAASHEFAAPLRRIVNLTELVARRSGAKLDGESSGMLARVRDSALRLRRLMDGLVEYAQQESGCENARDLDLDAVADRALERLKDRLVACDAELVRGKLPRVWADAAGMSRVMGTLLDNAVKFRGERRLLIALWAERSGRDWVIAVRDNGIGIHPSDAERIFAVFDPVHSRREYGGLALGLAVCRKIVKACGGRLWLDSAPGEGSTFRFTVPALPEQKA